MVCRCYAITIGSRMFVVVAKNWHDALEKSLRHDPLKGEVKERDGFPILKIEPHYDTIVEDDWNQANVEDL